MTEGKPFKVSCYKRSVKTRSSVGMASAGATKQEAFEIGQKWVAEQTIRTGYFEYAPDIEVGFVITDMSR